MNTLLQRPAPRPTAQCRTPADPAYWAQRAVQTARRLDGRKLDYAPTTLAYVEAALQTLGDDAQTILDFGCYVGEIILRNQGGAWKRRIGPAAFVIELGDGRICDPIGEALNAARDAHHSLLSFYEKLFYSRAVKCV